MTKHRILFYALGCVILSITIILGAGCSGSDGKKGTDGTAGNNGFNTLISTTDLSVGDTNCPYGGQQFDMGLDNGDSEGTANDGTLQSGEIDASQYVCDGKPAVVVTPMDPPEEPAGQFTINTNGGEGTSSVGGHGGYFYLAIDYGSFGNIMVFETGEADASFSFPSEVSIYLGHNPLEVTEDLTVTAEPVGDDGDVVDGQAHTHLGSASLYIYDESEGADVEVTGIYVAAGATLTFELNYSSMVPPRAQISLENDVHNAGIITTEREGDNISAGGLAIYGDVYYGETDSMIDLTGDDGGDGGNLGLNFSDDNWGTTQTIGAFFNQGDIDTSGGNGDIGGKAGSIQVGAQFMFFNTGDLSALGGTGAIGAGGDGNGIDIFSDYGNNSNSGTINASGGDGAVAGGDAGHVYLQIIHPGYIRNTGDLISNGGNADPTCDAAVCSGGDGAYIWLHVYGGGVINSGNLTSTGGDGTTGPGGAGGSLDVGASYDAGWIGNNQPVGDFIFSGNIDLSGGDGTIGGSGGDLQLLINAEDVPNGQDIVLMGYTDIDLSGGDGASDGGNSGYFSLFNEFYSAYYPSNYGPSGGVVNYADITANGGSSTGGLGGNGGDFDIQTDDEYGFGTEGEIALNFGDLSLNGGAGNEYGGYAGYVYIWGYNQAENHGTINATGGAASAEGGEGGNGGDSRILSDLGPAVNTAAIDTSGGDAMGSKGSAGNAGLIEIVGSSVSNSGDLIASGGDSNTDIGAGGDGNVVLLYGIDDGSQNTATSIDVSPGEGSIPGTNGEVYIDGMNVTDDWYTP